MFLKPLSKYSLINAKVRARLSSLLSVETINRLAEARDLSEFYSKLSGTVYEDIFSLPQVKADPKFAEKMLVEREVGWHNELLSDLKGNERDLIAVMLEGYEINNIKVAMRIRERGSEKDQLRYIVTTKLPHAIPYTSIVSAKSVEDVVPLLAGTPYAKAVANSLEAYREKGTLFPIEISLEQGFYRRLLECVSRLSGNDRKIASKLVGLEIDVRNLSLLVRLKFYYSVPAGDLWNYTIPGGVRIKREKLKKAMLTESMDEFLGATLEKSFSFSAELLKGGEELSKLYLLEVILWNHLVLEARKALGGFPFTIGTVISYLILKRNEIRNLITLLNAKILRLDKEGMEDHLRGLF